MAQAVNDWQISCKALNARGTHLLRTGQWTDCTFVVGNEPNQTVFKGHKLLLAMASPVFEAMFYGGIPEGNEPILILDLQPEAFKALLEYIYSDKININTFDKACELCYAAKKYMLPHLVQECTQYMWSDLHPKNACRAYEFAKLFEVPNLMEKCIQIISTQTLDVMSENSFEDIGLGTLISIFQMENLNIDSELDLFHAAVKYANAQINNQNSPPIQNPPKSNNKTRTELETDSCQITETESQSEMQTNETQEDDASQTDLSTEVPTTSNENKIVHGYVEQPPGTLSIRNAIQHIRFLTLTPQQFAEGPANTNLLTQAEAFAILMNISSSRSEYPMPEGFSTLCYGRSKIVVPSMDIPSTTQKRHAPDPQQFPFRVEKKYYCRRSIVHETDCLNTNDLECSVTFTVDKNVCVHGVQIPTQVLGENPASVPTALYYSELLYAHLLDADGSRLTYTHYTSRVPYSALLDITFNRPFYIQRNKVYKVAVVFNKLGWYPTGSSCTEIVMEDNVCFSFRVGPTNDSVRHSLIRSIIFGY